MMGRLKVSKNKKKRNPKKIVYTIIIAFAIVSFWRGVWGLMDLYLLPHHEAMSYLLSVIIGVVILIGTKHLMEDLI